MNNIYIHQQNSFFDDTFMAKYVNKKLIDTSFFLCKFLPMILWCNLIENYQLLIILKGKS